MSFKDKCDDLAEAIESGLGATIPDIEYWAGRFGEPYAVTTALSAVSKLSEALAPIEFGDDELGSDALDSWKSVRLHLTKLQEDGEDLASSGDFEQLLIEFSILQQTISEFAVKLDLKLFEMDRDAPCGCHRRFGDIACVIGKYCYGLCETHKTYQWRAYGVLTDSYEGPLSNEERFAEMTAEYAPFDEAVDVG